MIYIKNEATGEYDPIPAIIGRRGKSAYESALENGYIGTEEEWVERMKGSIMKITDLVSTDIVIDILPNVYYEWGTLASLTITLIPSPESSILDSYFFNFTSGDIVTDVLPITGVSWVGGATIIFPNKVYQCSIVNGIGVMYGV